MKQLTHDIIASRIFDVRSTQVMLNSDLAELYETETKFINRAVKRNESRFPEAFMFQLTEEEWNRLRFQIGTLNDTAIIQSVETLCLSQNEIPQRLCYKLL